MMKQAIFFRVITGLAFLFLVGCASLKMVDPNPPPLPDAPAIKKPIRVALVLGGGGVKGLAHVGVLEALEEIGVKPDLIVGCSAGAIVGALYADNPNAEHIKQLLLPLKSKDMLEFKLTDLPFGLTKGQRLNQFLDRNLTAKYFHDLKIPFVSVATELQSGKVVAFGKGEITPTVQASSAYPGVFHPVKLYGRYFVDGGVADPVPVQVARDLGAHVVIAVDVGEGLTDKEPSHLLGVMKRSIEIAYIKQSKLSAKDADIVIRVPFKDVGSFTDEFNGEIYQLGIKSAKKHIREIQVLLPNRRNLG